MTIKLALPLFGDEVAPRFCVADEVLVVEVSDGADPPSHSLSLAGTPWPERLSRLSGQGVTVLLCGGINRRFMPLARNLGIQVIWGLAGRADQLIDAYCRGEIERFCLSPREGRSGGPPRVLQGPPHRNRKAGGGRYRRRGGRH